jgi:mannose-6-phosphate isomerase class I
MESHTITPIEEESGDVSIKVLCACRYFAAELLDLQPGARHQRTLQKFDAWTIISGNLTFEAGGETVAARHGQSLLVVPDLQKDILQPLASLDVPRKQIEALAGDNGMAEFGASSG